MFVCQQRTEVRIRRTKVHDRLYLKSDDPAEQVSLLLVGAHPQNFLQQNFNVSPCIFQFNN